MVESLQISRASLAGRALNRLKREAILRIPPVRRAVEVNHDGQLRRYRPSLPPLAPRHREMVGRVARDGVVVTTLDELDLPGTSQLCAGLEALTKQLSDRPRNGSNILRPSRPELFEDVAIWQWGLQEPLLDIAENHIGLPVRYYGADVRCEVADGALRDVRQWHRDIEDHRMLKILVWLNDVDTSGGPFEHIARQRTDMITRSLRYVSGFVADDVIEHIVGRREWRQAVGPRWTAVVADTSSVFHRAMPPQGADRYSVTFTWTSRHPIKTMPADPISVDQAERIRAGLTPRQLACLPRGVTDAS